MNGITLNVQRVHEVIAVYMHMDPDDGIIKFVGHSPLDEILNLKDARCNSLWPSIFQLPGKSVTIAISSVHFDREEAYKAQRQLVAELKPICNVKGFWISPHRQSVACNETGEVWPTVAAAAAAHNLSPSALSNHLNGKKGHVTVKGRTYRRTV